MNVMAKAHETVRNYIATAKAAGHSIKHLTYRDLLKGALRVAHRAFKAMFALPCTKTEAGQLAIRKQGEESFKDVDSKNPYREGTHAFTLFMEGWLMAYKASVTR